jgi:hypothetical protein
LMIAVVPLDVSIQATGTPMWFLSAPYPIPQKEQYHYLPRPQRSLAMIVNSSRS